MLAPAPPLQPSGDEGRRLLREELVHDEYHRHDLLQRLLDWLWRQLQNTAGAASGANGVSTFVTMVIGAALVVGLVVLLSRVRRDRRERARSAVVLGDDRPTAAELRRRAEEALAAGRSAEALLDAFRALAARQVERGRLDDLPGATAHEVAATLATTFPAHGERVGHSADLFDATLYGDHPVTPDDAHGVLDLDATLAGSR
jgi:type II secretory pathway pseudopilin PulG